MSAIGTMPCRVPGTHYNVENAQFQEEQANITMLHVPVNWTGVTNNMLHSCWIKNNRHPKASAYSSLLHINGTLNRSSVVGDGGAESGGSDKLRLTHTRIRAATHAAFGRLREQCHS